MLNAATTASAPAAAAAVPAVEATTRAAPLIQAIDASSVHRICSGQVIVDLSTAVKELIENSLDAAATSITISMVGHGAHTIEVADNGAGVRADCYASLALKHWTSKLRHFADLKGVSSFGFRGEALSSLCALADLRVTTRCAGEAMATLLQYSSEGTLVERGPASRTVGTTVSLTQLFKSLPVRHKVFMRNVKKEYAKMLNVVQSYALVSTGVRIHVYHTPTDASGQPSGSRTLVLSTQGSRDMRELITNVFGAKQAAALQEIDTTLESNEHFKLNEYFVDPAPDAAAAAPSTAPPSSADAAPSSAAAASLPASASAASIAAASSAAAPASSSSPSSSDARPKPAPFRLVGFVSRAEAKCGRSAADRQYLYVNGRPVDLPRLARVINDAYRACNAQTSFPVLVLNLILPAGSFDVNLTPNKRETMLHDEAAILGLTKQFFQRLFEPSMYTYRVKSLSEFGITAASSSSSAAAVVASADSPSQSLTQQDSDDEADESEEALLSSSQEGSKTSEFGSPAAAAFASPQTRSPAMLRASSSIMSPVPSSCVASPKQRMAFSTPEPLLQSRVIATPTSGSSTDSPVAAWSGQSMPNNKRAASAALTSASMDASSAFSKPARPLAKVLESLPATSRAPAAYAAALQPLTTPPLLRHQSTPAIPAAPSSMRSTNSFLAAFARRGSSVQVMASNGVKQEADADAAATAAVKVADKAGASEERLFKRLRAAESAETLPPPGSNTPPLDSLARPDLSRQPTVLLARSPSPAAVAASPSPSASSSFSPSPEVPMVDDLFAETDIGVDYRSNASQRKLPVDMDAFERFYSDDGAASFDEPAAGAAASLVNRAGTVLSPSTASAALISAAAAMGAGSVATNDGCAASASSAAAAAAVGSRVLSEDTLRRVIEKDDFKAMQVVGQFNLGFIIAKLNEDLFIIDQHATDEKYRFEVLQRSTVINSQPLLQPMPLDCTPAMQETIRAHLDVFKLNGFTIDMPAEDDISSTADDALVGDSDAAVHAAHMTATRTRVRVKTLPFSKNLTFGADDIYELAALLADSPSSSAPPRLPKVTSMFASRACRSAVMIGTALSRAQMTNIVHNMSKMDMPWACPHGRPTMRHLVDLSQLHSHEDQRAAHFRVAGIGSLLSPPPAAVAHSSSPSPCCAH